ncbi:MAG: hypothetical protein Q4E55_08550, partial [Bacteroidales bacterium]|nr:hypothetical protein [Bacteroidales bacterium]
MTRNVLLGILVGLVVVEVCVLGVERHVAFQKQISGMIERKLEGVFGSQVTIGSVQSDLLNRISMKDVNLKDTMGNDFLYIGRLLVKYDLVALVKHGDVRISKVQLYGLDLRIRREDPQAEPNYTFLVDALKSNDTLDTDRKLRVDVKSVLVRNGVVSYDIMSEPDTIQAFDAHHVRLSDVNLSIKVAALQADTLDAVVERLSAKERSGFELKECTMNLKRGKHHLRMEHLRCRLPDSQLDIPSFTLQSDTPTPAIQWNDSLAYEGDVAVKLTPNDLAMFVPLFRGKTQHVEGKVSVKGRGENLMLQEIAIDGDSCATLRGSLVVNGLTRGEAAQVSADVSQLTLKKSAMQSWTDMDNAFLNRLEQVDVMGLVKGEPHDFYFQGNVECDAGMVVADLNVRDEHGKPVVKGSIGSERLDLGTLLGDSRLGVADIALELNEQACTFDSFVTLDRDNGDVCASGSVSLQDDFPTGNISVSLGKIRPKQLNLFQADDSLAVSLNLTAQLMGSSLESVQGTLHIDSLQLYNADTLGYATDGIVVNLHNNGGRQKTITLSSPFMKGKVDGQFRFASIAQTLRRILATSMPVLSEASMRGHDNNSIRFDCRLTDAEPLSRLMNIPIRLNHAMELSGQFDEAGHSLSVKGNVADMLWNGTRYEAS